MSDGQKYEYKIETYKDSFSEFAARYAEDAIKHYVNVRNEGWEVFQVSSSAIMVSVAYHEQSEQWIPVSERPEYSVTLTLRRPIE